MLALLTSGYYRTSFLPGHARLELLVRVASFRRWGLPTSGPHQHDRLPTRLVTAGLHDAAVRVFPRVAFPVDDAARTYLERAVWPEVRVSAAECGADTGMSAADRAEFHRLSAPGEPGYVLDEPGYHLIHPAMLVTGQSVSA